MPSAPVPPPHADSRPSMAVYADFGIISRDDTVTKYQSVGMSAMCLSRLMSITLIYLTNTMTHAGFAMGAKSAPRVQFTQPGPGANELSVHQTTTVPAQIPLHDAPSLRSLGFCSDARCLVVRAPRNSKTLPKLDPDISALAVLFILVRNGDSNERQTCSYQLHNRAGHAQAVVCRAKARTS